jgi:large subunit ribosomal protein LP1
MSLYGNSKDEFVTSLAAIALYDGEAEITAAQINALLSATNNTVAPYWPALFASFLKPSRIESIIVSGGAAGGAASAAVAAPAAAAAGGAAEEKPKEKPKVEEVDALEGGMDMFGGGGDY